MGTFSGLGHVALRVNDLDASLDFYSRLGFPEFLRLTQADGTTWIVYLRISDALVIELFPGGDGGRVAAPERTGVNHLCLTTTDIERTAAHLAAVGIAATAPLDPARRGVDGNRGMWIEDPDGNRIEIMEMADDCLQHEALRALHAGAPPRVHVRPI